MRGAASMIALAGVVVIASSPALAREDFVDLSVAEARESSAGKEKLKDVPFYMKGQKHKRVAQDLGTFKSNKRTNAFNKSDEEACKIAFLSAIITFQDRVRRMGGDAVVDIVSITKDNKFESASEYRCAAGNIIANVALSGKVVKFK